MTDDDIEISRRTLLAGLGGVGIASAGVGAGTTAYFSDREELTGNVFAAGELNLRIDYETTYVGATTETDEGTVDGGSGVLFELDDVKPGDSGSAELRLTVADNPAWIWLCPRVYDVEGSLAAHVESSFSYEDGGSIAIDGSNLFAGDLNGGVRLDGNIDGGDAENLYGGCFSGEDEHRLEFEWTLPSDVGTDVRGGSLAFDLAFVAEQCRHNPEPENPCSDVPDDDGTGDESGGSECTTCLELGKIDETPEDGRTYVVGGRDVTVTGVETEDGEVVGVSFDVDGARVCRVDVKGGGGSSDGSTETTFVDPPTSSVSQIAYANEREGTANREYYEISNVTVHVCENDVTD